MKIHILLFLVICLIECKEKSLTRQPQEYFTKGDSIFFDSSMFHEKNLSELKRRMIDTGNPFLYFEVTSSCAPIEQSFIYSLVMANKYDYAIACFDMFHYYFPYNFELKKNNSSSWDNISKNRAFDYLIKSAELGIGGAQKALGIAYMHGYSIKKDVKKGRYWLKQSEQCKRYDTIMRYWFTRNGYKLNYYQIY